MADEPIPNFKFLIGVLWLTLGAAIAITLIDMKIKNDILKAAADFYTRMGTEVPNGDTTSNPVGQVADPDSVLSLHSVDNAARVEAAILGDKGLTTSKTRARSRRVQRGTTEDSGSVPTRPEPVDGDDPA